MVAERRRDIGMLRAVGTSRRTVMRLFLTESLLQGVIGTALGMLAGWAMAAGFFASLGPIFTKVARDRRWAGVRAQHLGHLDRPGDRGDRGAALLPARAAGRVTPMEAMRPQLGEVYARKVGLQAWIGGGLMVASLFGLVSGSSSLVGLGSVVFLIGIAMLAPAVVNPIAEFASRPLETFFAREGAIARSNLQRNPAQRGHRDRSHARLASIVAMITVVTSIFAGFTSYLTKSMSADYL